MTLALRLLVVFIAALRVLSIVTFTVFTANMWCKETRSANQFLQVLIFLPGNKPRVLAELHCARNVTRLVNVPTGLK